MTVTERPMHSNHYLKRLPCILLVVVCTAYPAFCVSVSANNYHSTARVLPVYSAPSGHLNMKSKVDFMDIQRLMKDLRHNGTTYLKPVKWSKNTRDNNFSFVNVILIRNLLNISTKVGFNQTVIEQSFNITARTKRSIKKITKPKQRRKKKNRIRNRGKGDERIQSQLVGLRSFPPNSKLVLSTSPLPTDSPEALLCPVWPNDSRIIVNCSNGRRVRSRCTVSCPPGFRFKSGTSSTRRCRFGHKPRKRKGFDVLAPSWSGRDDQFQCVTACKALKPPVNGYLNCMPGDSDDIINTVTRSCEVICHPGYAPSHTTIRHCQSSGTWTGVEATCKEIPAKEKHQLFVLQQTVKCGNVYGLTTFVHDRTTFLIAADKTGNSIRIYKWNDGGFLFVPWQTISVHRPLLVEVVPLGKDIWWLLIAVKDETLLYRINSRSSKFVYIRSAGSFLMTKIKTSNLNETEGVSFFKLKGDIYRCKGHRSRQGRSIAFVQKSVRKGNRPKFRRVMRRKLKVGMKMYQCVMFASDNKLHTFITANRSDGRGKILVGTLRKGRMKILQTLRSRNLRHLSDAALFMASNNQPYIVVSQSTANGRCFVYKWGRQAIG